MNIKSILIIALLLSQFLNVNSQELKNDSNRIFWTDSVKLSWSDFQDEADEKKSIAALSSIAIPFNFETDGEGEIDIQIRVCFVKDESWSKVENQNELLLKHEQLHFDIAELHRRKIVKALKNANLTKSNYAEKLEAIVSENWSGKYREMQDQYDRETNFSQYIKEQLSWSKKIDALLKEYANHQEKELTLSLINFED